MTNEFSARIDPLRVDEPLPQEVLIDGHSGYPEDKAVGDSPQALRDAVTYAGGVSREFPAKLWIEPGKRAERAKQNDVEGTWPINYVDRFTNQNPTHECTCHALTRVGEGCRNRQRGLKFKEGPKKDFRHPTSSKGSVWFSCLSIYSEANPGQWGGAGCRQVLEIAVRRGFLPDKTQPFDYKFKHALQGTAGGGNTNQSSGQFVKVGQFPSGWEETASLFKVQEVIFTDNWEEVVCLVLHGYLVEVGRSGHAIPYAFWNPTEEVMGYVDSYNVIRYDSKGTVRGASAGAFAISSMTVPDNWLDPAGTLAI